MNNMEIAALCTNCGFVYYYGPQGQCDCNPKHIVNVDSEKQFNKLVKKLELGGPWDE